MANHTCVKIRNLMFLDERPNVADGRGKGVNWQGFDLKNHKHQHLAVNHTSVSKIVSKLKFDVP